MGIKLVVAVTDNHWFNTLRQKPDLEEVNFWSPSATNFKALQSGELFLFKLHAPHNVIAGGGIFTHASTLPCSLAWETFAEANGADSFENMRSKIARYRRDASTAKDDFPIGCRILTQPFFLDERDWIPTPASFSRNIVTFKTYDTDEREGRQLWETVHNLLQSNNSVGEDPERYGPPTSIHPRLGQGAFRVLVTDIYQRRCAVTKERVLPVLEAAHIRPYRDGGKHEASNGLLLRRDIHSLFDAGYVTVTPDLHFEVSQRLKEEYENGKIYYALHGSEILTPSNTEQRPNSQALAWHNEHCFRE